MRCSRCEYSFHDRSPGLDIGHFFSPSFFWGKFLIFGKSSWKKMTEMGFNVLVWWTFLLLALVTSARCFQRFPAFREAEDHVLDQFVEETALERDHFRRGSKAPPVADDGRAQAGSRATAPPGGHRRRYATIPGKSGLDYPLHSHVPLTTFYCYNQKHPGYYADPEAGCQVFHVCNVDGRQDSFLCPPGTIFNQPYFVCDWWFNVDCRQAPRYYALNGDLHATVQRVQQTAESSSRQGRQKEEEEDLRWRSDR